MNQTALFHETEADALGADITAAGGFKVVAGKLWPADAHGAAKLRNALNPDQPHKLDLHEVLRILQLAREAGSTAYINFQGQKLGFSVTWLDPRDEADSLRREFLDGVGALKRLADRIERAEERATVTMKVVR